MNMNNIQLHFFILFVSLSVIPFSLKATDCDNAMTTLEINQCAEADFEQAEMQLQEVFDSVLEKISTMPR